MNYRMAFVRDYEKFGTNYVQEKYCINNKNNVSNLHYKYKLLIETCKFESIILLVQKLDELTRPNLIYLYKDIKGLSKLEFCLKYKVKYVDRSYHELLRVLTKRIGDNAENIKCARIDGRCKLTNKEKFIFIFEYNKYGRGYIKRKYKYSRDDSATIAYKRYKQQLKIN
jgi:hypothetical protein